MDDDAAVGLGPNVNTHCRVLSELGPDVNTHLVAGLGPNVYTQTTLFPKVTPVGSFLLGSHL